MTDNLCKILGDIKYLPPEQMKNILALPNAQNYVVAGYYDYLVKHLVLFRGDGSVLFVPKILFFNSKIFKAELEKFEIINWGQTIKLGDYEVSADSVFYDLDSVYKEKIDKFKRENNE